MGALELRSESATVSNHYGGTGRAVGGSFRLDDLDNLVEATDYFSENYVLAIEPASLHGSDEELGAVRVWTSVGHGEQPWLVV